MKEDSVKILSLKKASDLLALKKLRESLATICLESAASPVEEGAKREAFLNRWLFQYLDKYPDFVFCAIEEESNVSKVLGYILGHPSVAKDLKNLDQSGLDLWQEFYSQYPAHLHINCGANARGKGVGSKLLKRLEDELWQRGVSGLHLVTAKGARNVGFYERNAYQILHEEDLSGTQLLLLGKSLGKLHA